MKKFSISVIFIFGLDIFLLCCGFYNANLLLEKPALTYSLNINNDNCTDCLTKNDVIISINNFKVNSDIAIETIIDFYKIGDNVSVKILRNENEQILNVKLTNYYDLFFVVLTFLTMLFFLLPGIFIIYRIENRQLAIVFHLLMVSVSTMLILTYGSLSSECYSFILIIRTINQLSYLLFPLSFIHFSLLFPVKKNIKIESLFKYFYLFIAFLSPVFLIINYNYIFHPGQSIFLLFENMHKFFLRPFFIPALLIVMFSVFKSYITSTKQTDKEKLLWIIVSVCWGPAIYTFLYLIPDIALLSPIISESLMQILIIVSPVTLFIGIYKYQLFDIRLLLKRSFIYGFLFASIVIIYFSLLIIFSELIISEVNQIKYAALITTGLTVILNQPARSLAQKIIDKTMFKINFDYNKAQELITSKLEECISEQDIALVIEAFFNEYLNVEKYNLLLYDTKRNDFIPFISRNFDLNKHQLFQLSNIIIEKRVASIIAKHDIISDDFSINNNSETLLDLGADLIIGNYDYNDNPESCLILSNKINKTHFTPEEIELIKYLVKSIIKRLQSIEIQKIMLFQNEEIKKLEELNNLKNYFVSNVSHELKTPLTAISLYSEIMMSNTLISPEDRTNYLKIVVGECARLSRLINNILDFSKMERGVKYYSFRNVDLNEVVDSFILTIDYFIQMKNFKLSYIKNEANYIINADSDALKEVIYNLIDNSIKYSEDIKEITIKTNSENNKYYFEISDKGKGMSKEHHEAVFDAYYRIDNSASNSTCGTGIGLNIVSNIIKAHNGRIFLTSEFGYGTTIKIEFPECKK